MENASKALIMAGGVLIGILIISLAVYLFTDFGSISAQINAQNAQKQIVEFNSKFTSYEGYKDKDGNWKITIYDIITLAGYAKEYNEYYGKTGEESIKVIIKDGINIDMVGTKFENLSDSQIYLNKGSGTLRIYECSNILYDSEGRVRSITFK